jgi:hypothetical protein
MRRSIKSNCRVRRPSVSQPLLPEHDVHQQIEADGLVVHARDPLLCVVEHRECVGELTERVAWRSAARAP